MARRNTRTAESPDSTDTTTKEAPVSESTTEAAAPAAETKPKAAPVDLSNFTAAVTSAVGNADTSTGTVPEADLSEVTTQYRALEGIKAKNEAKAHVNEQMKNAMNSDDLATARAYLSISENALVAAAAGAKSSTPADPTENYCQRVATLTLAYQLAVANVPEGVGEGWEAKSNELVEASRADANSLLEWNNKDPESRGEEPEASAVVRNSVKLATGKAAKAGVSRGGGTFTGERRDIGAHIMNAFEGKSEGDFLTIAEVRNTRSDEYGDTPPSAGAISARLFPKSGTSTMEKVGIKGDTQDGKKGAVKIALAE